MAFATGNLIDSCKRISTNKARCKDTNLFPRCKGFSVHNYMYYAFLTQNAIFSYIYKTINALNHLHFLIFHTLRHFQDKKKEQPWHTSLLLARNCWVTIVAAPLRVLR